MSAQWGFVLGNILIFLSQNILILAPSLSKSSAFELRNLSFIRILLLKCRARSVKVTHNFWELSFQKQCCDKSQNYFNVESSRFFTTLDSDMPIVLFSDVQIAVFFPLIILSVFEKILIASIDDTFVSCRQLLLTSNIFAKTIQDGCLHW